MAEINLLQTENPAVDQGFGVVTRLVAKILSVILVVVVLVYVGLYVYGWLNGKRLTSIKSDIQTAQSEALANKDRQELVTRQEQLGNLETLIDNHLYWSHLLPELARVTLKSARYTEIEASSDGKLNLAVTLPSYEEVEKYMQIFDLPEYNQQFSNVRILSIETVQADTSIEIQLRLELNFNPEYIKGRL